ncbi:MAG: CinA family protein [Cyclobacteriaceae bacterium]
MILGDNIRWNNSKMYNVEEISQIKDYMVNNHHTLGVAESVTSGHIQAAFSLATDASKFFQGGITAYNLGQKSRHLHVNPIHATACNSVSDLIADQMAVHALSLFSSDWSIGITGYASPLPELGIKDLFAFYSIAFRGKIAHRGKVECEDKGLYQVQVSFARQVVREFNCYLTEDKNSKG